MASREEMRLLALKAFLAAQAPPRREPTPPTFRSNADREEIARRASVVTPLIEDCTPPDPEFALDWLHEEITTNRWPEPLPPPDEPQHRKG